MLWIHKRIRKRNTRDRPRLSENVPDLSVPTGVCGRVRLVTGCVRTRLCTHVWTHTHAWLRSAWQSSSLTTESKKNSSFTNMASLCSALRPNCLFYILSSPSLPSSRIWGTWEVGVGRPCEVHWTQTRRQVAFTGGGTITPTDHYPFPLLLSFYISRPPCHPLPVPLPTAPFL